MTFIMLKLYTELGCIAMVKDAGGDSCTHLNTTFLFTIVLWDLRLQAHWLSGLCDSGGHHSGVNHKSWGARCVDNLLSGRCW